MSPLNSRSGTAASVDGLWDLRKIFENRQLGMKPGCGWLPGDWLFEDGLRRSLRAHAADARLSQRLARIALDAPVPDGVAGLQRQPVDTARLDALLERLRIGPLTRSRAHQREP